MAECANSLSRKIEWQIAHVSQALTFYQHIQQLRIRSLRGRHEFRQGEVVHAVNIPRPKSYRRDACWKRFANHYDHMWRRSLAISH